MDPTPAPDHLRRIWRSPVWRGALIVGLVAVTTRAIVALAQPHGLYFPDSWCYVIERPGPPCMAHDPATGWFWTVGTFGMRSASSVLWLQGILGIATALVLYRILVALSSWRWAVAGACLFAVLPVQLLMERTFLSETVETFLLAVALLAALGALRSLTAGCAVLMAAVASLAMGGALAVHTAFLLPAVATGVMLIVLVARHLSKRSARRWLMSVALAIVTLLGLLLPALPEAATYHRWFGVWTTDVSQGTFLLTRWAPLVTCHVPAGTTPRAKQEIKAACRIHSFGTPPGITQYMTWTAPFTYGASTSERIAAEQVGRTEAQLRSTATTGMLAHPGAFAGQLLDSVGWQLVGAPVNDLWQYRSPRFDRFVSPGAEIMPNFTQWFGPAGIPRVRPGDSALKRAAAATTRGGQILLWVILGLGAWRFARRRQHHKPWFPRLTPRTGMGWLTTTMVGTSMAAVAFGTYPVFRYWSPIMPALIVLAVLAATSVRVVAPNPLVEPERERAAA